MVQSSLAELLSLQRAAVQPPVIATVDPAVTSVTLPSPAPVPVLPPVRPAALPPAHSHALSRHPASHPGPLGLHSGLYEPSLRSSPRPPLWRTASNDCVVGRRTPSPPVDTSALPSDDEDDPLEPSAVIYNNMLSLAEAARLKADGHLDGESEGVLVPPRPPARTHPFDYDLDSASPSEHPPPARPHKRQRMDDPQLRRALPTQRGDNTQFRNPVEMGFCTPEKGKALFDLFMQGGQIYVPIFDPEVDTWESLCDRSPFAVTALIMVGSKIEDAGSQPSELQTKCRQHAEMIGACVPRAKEARADKEACTRSLRPSRASRSSRP